MSSSNKSQDEESKLALSEDSKYEAGRRPIVDPPVQHYLAEREIMELHRRRLHQFGNVQGGLNPPAGDWQLRPISAFTASQAQDQVQREQDNMLLARAARLPHGATAFLQNMGTCTTTCYTGRVNRVLKIDVIVVVVFSNDF